MFSGLSTLRPKETKVAEKSEAAKKLESYLASKYSDGAGDGDAGKKKRKKKKKPAASNAGGGILVMDEDVSGFASVSAKPGPSELEGEDEDYQPIVVNEEGAQRAMRIVEQEKQRFESRADGSGWKSGDAASRGRKRHDSPEEDLSPPRRKRHDSPEGDLSPPRRKRQDSPDLSPPRRKRHDSPEGDLSPPRRKRQDSPDLSPPRRKRHDSPEGDFSPPRRKRQDSPDLSPPRRKRHDSPEGELSPPRRKRQDSPDLSPPRRKRHDSPEGDFSPPRKKQAAATSSAAVIAKMSDGAAAGMISGKALKDELENKKLADQKRWKEMDESVSGRNADTVYRDKSGKRYTSKAEYMAAMDEQKKEKANKHVTEEELEWGGGMKQKKKKQAALEAMQKEAAKPFARRKDDAELDAMQKDVLRWGDPMAHLVTKRLPTAAEEVAPSLVNEKNKKAMKKSGFIVPQEVPKHSWIRRGLGAPPNRYGIKPGRHWDGVNRSNGFEEKMWKEQSKIRAKETEAFMFLQSDM